MRIKKEKILFSQRDMEIIFFYPTNENGKVTVSRCTDNGQPLGCSELEEGEAIALYRAMRKDDCLPMSDD